MAKLVYSFGGAIVGEFPLEKERTTIGRRTYNDIHIDNLAVSGEHAVVVAVGDKFYVEDLESTNGTVVNGRPVRKHMLHHGDTIWLGKHQLQYLDEQQNVDLISNPKTQPQPDPTTDEKSPGEESQTPACLRVLTGRGVGNLLQLSKALTTMGKPGVQVGAIVRRTRGYFVVQVEGEENPVVNGEPLMEKSRHLDDLDVLEIAGVKLEFLSSMPDP